MMKTFSTVVCLLLLSLSLACRADVAQLHLHLSGTQSLSAQFTQKVRGEDGELLQESHGNIALQRPNKLRWESTEPYHYLLVSNGQTLWRYDADLEQLNEEPVDGELMQAPAMVIGASIEQLDRQFTVRVEKNGSEREFILTPRQEGPFTTLSLVFDSGKLVGMKMRDSLGQGTEIQFEKAKYNGKLAPSLFEFDKAAMVHS